MSRCPNHHVGKCSVRPKSKPSDLADATNNVTFVWIQSAKSDHRSKRDLPRPTGEGKTILSSLLPDAREGSRVTKAYTVPPKCSDVPLTDSCAHPKITCECPRCLSYLAAGRNRLLSCRHVWRFMLPAADQAGNRRAKDGRKPEQPELRDIGSASKQRRTGASRRVDRSVGNRDQEEVNER
jgi:hypothetical protein